MQSRSNTLVFSERIERTVRTMVQRFPGRRLTAFVLTFAMIAGLAMHLLGSVQPVAAQAPLGSWAATGSMATARWSHAMTPLQDGRVLVVGGSSSSTHEIYNPATGAWTTGAAPLNFTNSSAVRLADGRVLVTAGNASIGTHLFNPATNSWSQSGNRSVTRLFGATATLLPDGRVLLAGGNPGLCGGFTPCPPTQSEVTEIYDPNTGTWSITGSMSAARYRHSATLLPDGRVLVAGGFDDKIGTLGTAEIYNPATGAWSATANLANARSEHNATLLLDGRVLVAGGKLGNNSVTSAELYNPASGTWSSAGQSQLGGGRPAARLANGRVLVTNGSQAVLYDPPTNTWLTASSMLTPRSAHKMELLGNGQVLVSGGIRVGGGGAQASAELYTP